jgi:hypothetical protein
MSIRIAVVPPSTALLAAVLAVPFAGCHSAGTSASLPDGEGRGLVAFDRDPPADAVLYQRPEWRVGDSFELVRGGAVRAKFTVTAVEPDRYVLADENGARLLRDRDLGNLGNWPADAPEPTHLLSPVDVRFHWPLWVGKRWRCEYVDRERGGPALPLEARYEVEDLDTVRVPAGTFAALRIVRTVRLVSDQGKSSERTQIVWYAPSIGAEVRQILGDTSVELVAQARQAS